MKQQIIILVLLGIVGCKNSGNELVYHVKDKKIKYKFDFERNDTFFYKPEFPVDIVNYNYEMNVYDPEDASLLFTEKESIKLAIHTLNNISFEEFKNESFLQLNETKFYFNEVSFTRYVFDKESNNIIFYSDYLNNAELLKETGYQSIFSGLAFKSNGKVYLINSAISLDD